MLNLVTALILKVLFVLMLFSSFQVFSQPIVWERALGGNHNDYGYAIVSDSQGNFYVAGSSSSTNNGDLPISCYQGPTPIQNPWVIKMNSLGQILWSRCIWIDGEINSIKCVNDTSFALTGWLRTTGGTLDLWVASIDSSGNFGALNFAYGIDVNSEDIGYDIVSAGNDHFWAVGKSNSVFGNGDYDFFVMDATATSYNTQVYGGSDFDQAHKILKLQDGNYLIVGSTFSTDGDVTFNHGSGDIWIVKIDSLLNIIWQKTYGGSNWDAGFGGIEDSEGHIYISGWTESNDGDVTDNHGDIDGWIFKIDSVGNLIWQKCLGGLYTDVIYTSPLILGDKLVVAASASSSDGDVIGNHNTATADFWIVQLDTLGNIITSNCYGGSYSEFVYDVKLGNGNIYAVGKTESSDGDVTGYHFNPTTVDDAWALILDSAFFTEVQTFDFSEAPFSLYPNPSSNIVVVSSNILYGYNSFSIMVSNVYGQNIIEDKICNSPYQLNISDLTAGLYYCSIEVNGKKYTYKIIKL